MDSYWVDIGFDIGAFIEKDKLPTGTVKEKEEKKSEKKAEAFTQKKKVGAVTVIVTANAGSKTFTNVYTADGSIAVTGSKYLEGNRPTDIAAGEFSFELLDGTKVVSKGTTYIAGHIHFTPIQFVSDTGADEPYVDGSHESHVYHNVSAGGKTLTLKAREVAGTDPTITYESKRLTVRCVRVQ